MITSTDLESRILDFMLSEGLGVDHEPIKLVVLPTMNSASLAGLPTMTHRIPILSNLGEAGSATEGTEYTTLTSFGYDDPVDIPITEMGIVLMELTRQAIQRFYPAFAGDPLDIAKSGDLPAIVSMLQGPYNKAVRMIIRKLEKTAAALFASATNSVGAVGDTLSPANMILALYKMKLATYNHEDWRYILDPKGVMDLQNAMTAADYNASSWFQQADASFLNQRRDLANNGYKGSFLGVPLFETTPDVLADVTVSSVVGKVQGLVAVGIGDAAVDGAQVGWAEWVEGQQLNVNAQPLKLGKRGVEFSTVQEGGMAVLDTGRHFVKIISKKALS